MPFTCTPDFSPKNRIGERELAATSRLSVGAKSLAVIFGGWEHLTPASRLSYGASKLAHSTRVAV